MTKFPAWKDLLNESVKDMIFDVQYSKLHTDYKIQNDKIGYKIHDHYNFNTNKGYLTQFAYIKEKMNGKVSSLAVA